MNALFAAHSSMDTPGAAVAVMRDGATLFKAAYGPANIAKAIPATTDTAFHLASAGKQMTALAILMLQEDGRLSVDDLVAKHLPEFTGWGGKVTIRHLLYHTSGLTDYYEDIEDSFRRPTNRQALRYLADYAELDFRPGTRTSYSNSGYDTLGAIVAKVSKQPFATFMRNRIFVRAGMLNTFAFSDAARRASKRATGYSEESGELYVDDTSPLNLLHGSGSIYTTVEDMVRYDAALFGFTFVNQSTLSEAFKPGKLKNGRSLDYGFGWDLSTDSTLGLPYYGHSGEWMGFGSYYLHYPSNGVSVVVLSNSSNTDAESLAFGAAKIAIKAGL